MAAVAVGFTLLNPILFSPPADDEAWMTRVVHAERWWTTDEARGVLDLSYPNVLNVLNIPVSGYAFLAAYRRRPFRAVLAGLVSMALKLWYVSVLVRRYDAERSRSS